MTSSQRLSGRVAIVTGAGRGLGLAHARALARYGAAVVVNDVGGESGPDGTPSEQAVADIVREGGRAISNASDVSDWEQVEALVQQAISTFGRLDILVNNAGLLRDRAIINMTSEEWDLVLGVHLKGSFATIHFAAQYWRDMFKAGEAVAGRVINTTSVSGLYCYPGQANYGSAKAGIAALTGIAAKELARYGVTVNAISPAALTRMTEGLESTKNWSDEGEGPAQVGELVAWLASDEAAHVSGQVFGVGRGQVYLNEPWKRGPAIERPGGFKAEEYGAVVADLLGHQADAE
jgi:NAD(P)-dependent dehydrogenase (short-subunit alcohol dehydrogenase family)